MRTVRENELQEKLTYGKGLTVVEWEEIIKLKKQLKEKSEEVERFIYDNSFTVEGVGLNSDYQAIEVDKIKELLKERDEQVTLLNDKIKECLEMCNNNESNHDYACATDSVRAILTKDKTH